MPLMNSVLTADLGGSKCRFARLTEDLQPLALRQVATPNDRGEFLDMLLANLVELMEGDHDQVRPASAIGIGTAGVVHRGGRIIDYAPNLPLETCCPLAELVEERLGLPTTLINDGRAAAVGEYHHGHAKGKDPLLTLFFGTGIGIGLIVEGEPFAGVSNAAGEIGHTLFRPGGLSCVCGRHGCFEAYCGGGPMCARALEQVGSPPAGVESWTVGEIVAAAQSEPRCRQILDDCELAAGAMVASACTLLNPAAVVLGGGVLAGWPELSQRIEAFTRSWCSQVVSRNLTFVTSRGGADAILWGAAAETGKLW